MSTPPFPVLEPDEYDLRLPDVLTFDGRFPDPAEIIQWGGKPGVQYLMVDPANLTTAINLPPKIIDGKPYKWGPTKDVNVYPVTGPKGTTTMMILSRGKPIPGADPANGIREWFYDPALLTTTGLTTPYGGVSPEQGSTQPKG